MSFPTLHTEIETLKAHLAKRESFTDTELSIVLSPYRISPLGSEIDYQGGPALSMTVNAYTLLAFIPVKERKIRLYSVNDPGIAEFDPGQIKSAEKNDWRRFAMGAVKILSERYSAGYGFTGAVYRTLPRSGLGISSSECLAYLNAFARSNNIDPLVWEYAEFVTRIKNNYLKQSSGPLDQLSTLNGRKDCMLHVNTGSGEVSAHPGPRFGDDYKVLIAYSGQPDEKAPYDMDKRPDECREASGFLGIMAGLKSGDRLSDIPSEVFYSNSKRLPDKLRRRAEHYFSEAGRVQEGLLAWRKGDMESFGRLMNESCSATVDIEKSMSVGPIMLHKIISSSEGVYGSTINGSYVTALVTNKFSEESVSDILYKYLLVCPEAQGKAAAFLAEPEGGLRIHG
jgi:galactokinase